MKALVKLCAVCVAALTAFTVIYNLSIRVSAQGRGGSAPDMPNVEPIAFHHVHLNSVNPSTAADYYPKAFSVSATRTTYNGYEAVKTGPLYLLFTKVATTPPNELTGPQDSIWHFGWNTPDSVAYDKHFREMILSSVASRVRRVVEHELAIGEPSNQRDVLEARRVITDLALDLAEKGEIELNPEQEDELVFR